MAAECVHILLTCTLLVLVVASDITEYYLFFSGFTSPSSCRRLFTVDDEILNKKEPTD